ncbi:MAG: uridine kinase [Bdellovibrionota bacterium]
MVIGISGGSGSGKTTFAQKLLKVIGAERASILAQDYYYKDQSQAFKENHLAVNFDHPGVLDFELMIQHLKQLKSGNSVECPQYDFKTHSRMPQTLKVDSHPVILIEGILIFHPPELLKEMDLTFFMEAPEELRLQRRIDRDTKERGRTEEDVREQFFRQVKPMHDQYVEPTKKLVSYVIKSY